MEELKEKILEERGEDNTILKTKDFLIKELKVIKTKIEGITIQYEYDTEISTHVVKILPIEIFNNRRYIELEIYLVNLLDSVFPEEEVLFISSDSLTSVRNPESI